MWRDELVRNGRRIIEGELARLARRSPELGQGELAAIDRTLDALLDRLIVERIGRLAEREPELADRAAALLDPGPAARWPKLRP
jgi:hypothetical protein